MPYCVSCGARMPETARFCTQCAAPAASHEPRPQRLEWRDIKRYLWILYWVVFAILLILGLAAGDSVPIG